MNFFKTFILMTINQRIRILIEAKEKNIGDIAVRAGVTKQTISTWVKDGGSVGMDVVRRLLDFYPDLNARWLITGTGEMLSNTSETNIVKEDPALYKNCPICREKERLIKQQQATIYAQEKTIDCLEKNGGAMPVGRVGKTGTK